MPIERYAAYKEWEAKEEMSPATFPNMRMNSGTVIDLFPNKMKPLECKLADGQIDHYCLSMPADHHLVCLANLKKAGHKCTKQFRAWGGQGYGWSTYFNDPTGLYIELRNYEEDRWPEVEAFAKTMLATQ